jgi:hypothetical protein
MEYNKGKIDLYLESVLYIKVTMPCIGLTLWGGGG